MYPCFCKSQNCSGKLIPRSTRSYHERMDRRAHSLAGLTLAVSNSTMSATATSRPSVRAPAPASAASAVSSASPTTFLDASSRKLHAAAAPPADPPPSPPDDLTPSEERGRLYMEQVEQGLRSSKTPNNIGSLWDDLEGGDDADNYPGNSAGEPSDEELDGIADLLRNSDHATRSSGWSTFADVGDPEAPDDNFPDPFQPSPDEYSTASLTHDPTSLFLLICSLHGYIPISISRSSPVIQC
ncbi:hypothetical protein HGRIS_006510 [Hohenbuehelia grisea]|uniref:Post-SET domain-containing protein n=1 Tax=Hohenbuehelia grisea TaxID=104357 RepID=A0ABR3J971_9AGAR